MRISKVHIQNYRNIKEISLELNSLVIFIGENNSGKSNILKAITLPFSNDEVGNISKSLGWQDINNISKNEFFTFLSENIQLITNDTIELQEFTNKIPYVKVDVWFTPDGADEYYVHKWISSLENDLPEYSITYLFYVENPKELLGHVARILRGNNSIENIKMNLLPLEFFKYTIRVNSTEEPVSYLDLSYFKYNALAAERDEFSNKNTQLGSKALVNLLRNKLSDTQKVEVEKSYEMFFNDLKRISRLDGIFNWQEHSNLDNAKEFFDEINLLPNMPSMNSLLNNVRLGFREEYLNTQGLGYRNLIYLLVMMNSLNMSEDIALNILTIEEPEAHLCINNERLLASFVNSVLSGSKQVQIMISTHSSEFLNKLALENVSVVSEGMAFSLKSVLETEEIDYLAKKPNIDFVKFLFSRRCILVEGPSEEMLIRSYISLQLNRLNDIEVISLHKGFTKMIDIWLKVNEHSSHRIGIIRDFDNQPRAQRSHEKYNMFNNVYVTTTTEYTLEPEFVNTGKNYEKLKKYFSTCHGWANIKSSDDLSDRWRGAKADTMLKFCQEFGTGDLADIELPSHISKVIKFLQDGVK